MASKKKGRGSKKAKARTGGRKDNDGSSLVNAGGQCLHGAKTMPPQGHVCHKFFSKFNEVSLDDMRVVEDQANFDPSLAVVK